MAEAAFKRGGKTTGVSTGYTDLDKLLGGFHPSDLVILAHAVDGQDLARHKHLVQRGARLPREQGAGRPPGGRGRRRDRLLLARNVGRAARIAGPREESRVSSDRIRRGDVSHDDFDRFVQASQRLASTPIFIDDTRRSPWRRCGPAPAA